MCILVGSDKKAVSVQQSSAHAPGCICDLCQCQPCKPGGAHEVSTAYSKQGVSTASSHAAHSDDCTCDKCICKSCIAGTNAQSFVSAKESRAGTPATKVESSKSAMPIHCNCPTCTCDEGKYSNVLLSKVDKAAKRNSNTIKEKK